MSSVSAILKFSDPTAHFSVMATEQDLLFEDRFLDRHAGPIISDAKVAIIELVANCWDAYATTVDIAWPTDDQSFSIADNGIGMTRHEFEARWKKIDYDRTKSQGLQVMPPPDLAGYPPRISYGRNGKGRHAAFYFSDPYSVLSSKDGQTFQSEVRRTGGTFKLSSMGNATSTVAHGTTIAALRPTRCNLTAEQAREIIGARFLTDPTFSVSVDGIAVTFEDIPSGNLHESCVDIPGVGTARILMIDVERPDKTTRQHGIAWRVGKRLVGTCGWHGSDYERVLDGRSSEAKRYTFVVFADFLAQSVKPDWTDFEPDDDRWLRTRPVIQDHIRNALAVARAQTKTDVKRTIRETLSHEVESLPPASRDRWSTFVDKVVDTCPSITATEVEQVAAILANLELASTKYGILKKFGVMQPGDFDDLYRILDDWTVGTAKVALDEIQTRLRLIEQLDVTLRDERADEVQDLQPLFDRSLWVFGPEFESIEFTSNKGMTTVIQQLFGVKTRGSLHRPDFVIVPDGSVGLYSDDLYDEAFEVCGVRRLVVAEIKKPGVEIGSAQIEQAWKYVQELIKKGLVTEATSVSCFVLGSKVDPTEGESSRWNERVKIRAMPYNTFIRRAEKRMLNLRQKLQDAPFLRDQGFSASEFVENTPSQQQRLI